MGRHGGGRRHEMSGNFAEIHTDRTIAVRSACVFENEAAKGDAVTDGTFDAAVLETEMYLQGAHRLIQEALLQHVAPGGVRFLPPQVSREAAKQASTQRVLTQIQCGGVPLKATMKQLFDNFMKEVNTVLFKCLQHHDTEKAKLAAQIKEAKAGAELLEKLMAQKEDAWKAKEAEWTERLAAQQTAVDELHAETETLRMREIATPSRAAPARTPASAGRTFGSLDVSTISASPPGTAGGKPPPSLLGSTAAAPAATPQQSYGTPKQTPATAGGRGARVSALPGAANANANASLLQHGAAHGSLGLLWGVCFRVNGVASLYRNKETARWGPWVADVIARVAQGAHAHHGGLALQPHCSGAYFAAFRKHVDALGYLQAVEEQLSTAVLEYPELLLDASPHFAPPGPALRASLHCSENYAWKAPAPDCHPTPSLHGAAQDDAAARPRCVFYGAEVAKCIQMCGFSLPGEVVCGAGPVLRIPPPALQGCTVARLADCVALTNHPTGEQLYVLTRASPTAAPILMDDAASAEEPLPARPRGGADGLGGGEHGAFCHAWAVDANTPFRGGVCCPALGAGAALCLTLPCSDAERAQPCGEAMKAALPPAVFGMVVGVVVHTAREAAVRYGGVELVDPTTNGPSAGRDWALYFVYPTARHAVAASMELVADLCNSEMWPRGVPSESKQVLPAIGVFEGRLQYAVQDRNVPPGTVPAAPPPPAKPLRKQSSRPATSDPAPTLPAAENALAGHAEPGRVVKVLKLAKDGAKLAYMRSALALAGETIMAQDAYETVEKSATVAALHPTCRSFSHAATTLYSMVPKAFAKTHHLVRPSGTAQTFPAFNPSVLRNLGLKHSHVVEEAVFVRVAPWRVDAVRTISPRLAVAALQLFDKAVHEVVDDEAQLQEISIETVACTPDEDHEHILKFPDAVLALRFVFLLDLKLTTGVRWEDELLEVPECRVLHGDATKRLGGGAGVYHRGLRLAAAVHAAPAAEAPLAALLRDLRSLGRCCMGGEVKVSPAVRMKVVPRQGELGLYLRPVFVAHKVPPHGDVLCYHYSVFPAAFEDRIGRWEELRSGPVDGEGGAVAADAAALSRLAGDVTTASTTSCFTIAAVPLDDPAGQREFALLFNALRLLLGGDRVVAKNARIATSLREWEYKRSIHRARVGRTPLSPPRPARDRRQKEKTKDPIDDTATTTTCGWAYDGSAEESMAELTAIATRLNLQSAEQALEQSTALLTEDDVNAINATENYSQFEVSSASPFGNTTAVPHRTDAVSQEAAAESAARRMRQQDKYRAWLERVELAEDAYLETLPVRDQQNVAMRFNAVARYARVEQYRAVRLAYEIASQLADGIAHTRTAEEAHAMRQHTAVRKYSMGSHPQRSIVCRVSGLLSARYIAELGLPPSVALLRQLHSTVSFEDLVALQFSPIPPDDVKWLITRMGGPFQYGTVSLSPDEHDDDAPLGEPRQGGLPLSTLPDDSSQAGRQASRDNSPLAAPPARGGAAVPRQSIAELAASDEGPIKVPHAKPMHHPEVTEAVAVKKAYYKAEEAKRQAEKERREAERQARIQARLSEKQQAQGQPDGPAKPAKRPSDGQAVPARGSKGEEKDASAVTPVSMMLRSAEDAAMLEKEKRMVDRKVQADKLRKAQLLYGQAHRVVRTLLLLLKGYLNPASAGGGKLNADVMTCEFANALEQTYSEDGAQEGALDVPHAMSVKDTSTEMKKRAQKTIAFYREHALEKAMTTAKDSLPLTPQQMSRGIVGALCTVFELVRENCDPAPVDLLPLTMKRAKSPPTTDLPRAPPTPSSASEPAGPPPLTQLAHDERQARALLEEAAREWWSLWLPDPHDAPPPRTGKPRRRSKAAPASEAGADAVGGVWRWAKGVLVAASDEIKAREQRVSGLESGAAGAEARWATYQERVALRKQATTQADVRVSAAGVGPDRPFSLRHCDFGQQYPLYQPKTPVQSPQDEPLGSRREGSVRNYIHYSNAEGYIDRLQLAKTLSALRNTPRLTQDERDLTATPQHAEPPAPASPVRDVAAQTEVAEVTSACTDPPPNPEIEAVLCRASPGGDSPVAVALWPSPSPDGKAGGSRVDAVRAMRRGSGTQFEVKVQRRGRTPPAAALVPSEAQFPGPEAQDAPSPADTNKGAHRASKASRAKLIKAQRGKHIVASSVMLQLGDDPIQYIGRPTTVLQTDVPQPTERARLHEWWEDHVKVPASTPLLAAASPVAGGAPLSPPFVTSPSPKRSGRPASASRLPRHKENAHLNKAEVIRAYDITAAVQALADTSISQLDAFPLHPYQVECTRTGVDTSDLTPEAPPAGGAAPVPDAVPEALPAAAVSPEQISYVMGVGDETLLVHWGDAAEGYSVGA